MRAKLSKVLAGLFPLRSPSALALVVGGRAERGFRGGDRVLSLGRGALLVLFPETPGEGVARAVERVFRGRGVAGLARFPEDGTTPEALAQALWRAFLRALEEKRAYAFPVPLPFEEPTREELLALLAQGVGLHYQPRVSLLTGERVGLEALLRLPNLSPPQVLGAARRHALLRPLTEAVVLEALEAAERVGLPVAVNLPPELLGKEFARWILARLRERDLPGEALAVEVTEEDGEVDPRGLLLLREAGVGVYLDDFGRGHSNLHRLVHLPLSGLKVDGEVVRLAAREAGARAALRAAATLAQDLLLTTVAEGVEHPLHEALARELGFHEGQGFHFGRPLPLEDLLVS